MPQEEVSFQMRWCRQCGLRYPVEMNSIVLSKCPVCGAETKADSDDFGRHVIPRSDPKKTGRKISAILDNIRSAWNVGAIFRTAEAAGVSHLYLCGITPTPNNPKVSKTSLGAESLITWSHHPNGLELIDQLRPKGTQIWALEGGQGSENIFKAPLDLDVTWVVGNENAGIDPGLLAKCDKTYYLPMAGSKESLNVVVALGIALFLSE